MKTILILISATLLSFSCQKNILEKNNKQFSKKYGKEVRGIMNDFSPKKTIKTKQNDYRLHSDIIGVSSIFNLENTKINHFNNHKIYNPQKRIAGSQMPIENFITVNEDLFKPKYQTFEKKPYRFEEVVFSNIEIPYNDIFGNSSNVNNKKYHLVSKKILQKEIDQILKKFDDEHRAILLRAMKDKEIIMERISKNNI